MRILLFLSLHPDFYHRRKRDIRLAPERWQPRVIPRLSDTHIKYKAGCGWRLTPPHSGVKSSSRSTGSKRECCPSQRGLFAVYATLCKRRDMVSEHPPRIWRFLEVHVASYGPVNRTYSTDPCVGRLNGVCLFHFRPQYSMA